MRRAVALILVLCYAVLGTGVVQHLHEAQHASACTSVDPLHHPLKKSLPGSDHCSLCLLLHQPLMSAQAMPSPIAALAPAGVLAALRAESVYSRELGRIDCRGPPERSVLV